MKLVITLNDLCMVINCQFSVEDDKITVKQISAFKIKNSQLNNNKNVDTM